MSRQGRSKAVRFWATVLVGLAIAYSPTYIGPLARGAGVDIGLSGPPSVILWNWLAVALLLTWVLAVERRGLASLRLTRPSREDLEWAVFFWGLGSGASVLLSALLPPPPGAGAGIDTLLAIPIPLLVALILTTATTEEILYKAYPIERVRDATGRLWVGVAFSLVLFALPHLSFFSPHWLVSNGVGLVLQYALYVWRRNLWACMLMHLLTNAMILLPATGLVGRG